MNCNPEQIEYEVTPPEVVEYFQNLTPEDAPRAMFEARQAVQNNPQVCAIMERLRPIGFDPKLSFCHRDATEALATLE